MRTPFKLLLFVLLLCLLALASVAAAQDATPAATGVAAAPVQPSVPVYATNEPRVVYDTVPAGTFVAIILVFGGTFISVFSAYAYSQHKTTQMIWQSTPRPIQQGGQLLLEAGLNEAAKTESPLDDMALEKSADVLGYDKALLPDGRIVLTQRAIAASGTP